MKDLCMTNALLLYHQQNPRLEYRLKDFRIAVSRDLIQKCMGKGRFGRAIIESLRPIIKKPRSVSLIRNMRATIL